MELAFLIAILLLGLVFMVAVFAVRVTAGRRLSEVEESIRRLESQRDDNNHQLAQQATLTESVYRLELEMKRLTEALATHAVAAAQPEPAPAPALRPEVVARPAAPQEPVIRTQSCQFCGRICPADALYCACGYNFAGIPEAAGQEPEEAVARQATAPTAAEPAIPAPEDAEALSRQAASPTPPPVTQVLQPRLGERLREKVGEEGWEALVGGNLLNKLGALVLVIGIALFLGYSFSRFGPAGRVAIGLGISGTLLAGGAVLERRKLYTVFARGLIAAGWAALYFTSYAMHAVPAARVIDNSFIGATLNLAVAAGMILHSLRYRVQTLTGLAYFTAFAALAVAPSTPFAVVALVPLAGSLLYLAWRLSWYSMALFGVIATYTTCISRGDSGAPLASAQALFLLYWLLFEAFDLIRTSRRESAPDAAAAIFPLNTVFFLALSYLKWSHTAPQQTYLLAAGTAALYLISAVMRAFLRPPSTFDAEQNAATRALLGGYEGALTVAALLAGLTICDRVPGIWISGGVAIEAELLVLAGRRLGQRYLERLGAAGFVFSLGRMFMVDWPGEGRTIVLGRSLFNWSPVAALHALLFYVNRSLGAQRIYSYGAWALVMLVLGFETPRPYFGLPWMAFGAVLFELGLRRRLAELRYQGHAAALLGVAAVLLLQSEEQGRVGWPQIAIAIVFGYAAAIRRLPLDTLHELERSAARWTGSVTAALGMVLLILKLVPEGYLGLAWLAVAALLLELSLRKWPGELKIPAYVVAALALLTLFGTHVAMLHKFAGRDTWISLGGGALLCWAVAARLFGINTDKLARDLFSFAASGLAIDVLWVVLPDALVAVGWMALAMLMYEVGSALSVPAFVRQGHIAAAAAFGRLFFSNFTTAGDTLGVSHRLLTVTPVTACLYYLWSRCRARWYLWAAAVAGFVLLRFELGQVFAVVGWAAFSLALLWIALRRKLPEDLRWQSYLIALGAFVRSWTTNFHAPESFAGLPGRLLTAGLVIGAFYAAQFVAPRTQKVEGGSWLAILDRHGRWFYSLLATTLVTVLLFHEISGGLLTVAWGVEGLMLLAAGFPLRERVLRLSGLVLMMTCILKLFVYDLRRLDTPFRILSFIALGVILMSVSWVYTRFRGRIREYL